MTRNPTTYDNFNPRNRKLGSRIKEGREKGDVINTEEYCPTNRDSTRHVGPKTVWNKWLIRYKSNLRIINFSDDGKLKGVWKSMVFGTWGSKPKSLSNDEYKRHTRNKLKSRLFTEYGKQEIGNFWLWHVSHFWNNIRFDFSHQYSHLIEIIRYCNFFYVEEKL